jgi:hypothetical protein
MRNRNVSISFVPEPGEKGFTDVLHGNAASSSSTEALIHRTDHLELRDLIHRIDVIHALLFVPIALMYRIDAEKAGLPRQRMRFRRSPMVERVGRVFSTDRRWRR